jgi:hypothetical protein
LSRDSGDPECGDSGHGVRSLALRLGLPFNPSKGRKGGGGFLARHFLRRRKGD